MPWTPPSLTTERLYLVSLNDLTQPEFVFENRPDDAKRLPGLPSNWTACLKENRQPVGSAGYVRWDREENVGEIGFIMMHPYRNKGYMTEALKAILDFGFKGMGLVLIEAKTLPANVASVRVLEKIGMKKERRICGRLSSKGPLLDFDLFLIGR